MSEKFKGEQFENQKESIPSRKTERGTEFIVSDDVIDIKGVAEPATDYWGREEAPGWFVGGRFSGNPDKPFELAEFGDEGDEEKTIRGGGLYFSQDQVKRQEQYKSHDLPQIVIDAIEASIVKAEKEKKE